ncbi:MAG: RIP metalloprotease RseP, partial [Bacteroidota bacterium]
EMGHFFPAKWFNTRVEKFYLFFDPWFELFKVKKGETEYGIGWLPLGGYVKISGMIDESMDREQMKQPPQPWEFRSKPAWQRLIIMLGGVTVNFILGFLLFGIVLWTYGERYLPIENVRYGIVVDELGRDLGLQDGDKVVAIGGERMQKSGGNLLRREIIINGAKDFTVERNGREVVVPVNDTFIDVLSRHENKNMEIYVERFPYVVDSLAEDSPASSSGLQVGDRIISLNGKATPYFSDFVKELRKGLPKVEKEKKSLLQKIAAIFSGSKAPEVNRSQDIAIGVIKNYAESGTDTVTYQLTTTKKEGRMGAYRVIPELATQEYNFAEAMPAGFVKGYNFLGDQIKAFGQMFKGKIKASESLGGFGSIAGMFDTSWNWQRFWTMTAILSLILGFMNLLPIPALDGGHVMFLLYEVVSGRKPSDKFMEIATIVGFVVVIALVLYANGMDIFRAITG